MAAENLLKFTYHHDGNKLNAYLRMPSPTFAVLKREISIRLFEERQLPPSEIRTFWIDADDDEIEIVNQSDYEIFMAQRSVRQPLQVAALISPSANPKTPSAKPKASSVPHRGVECDVCKANPIVGFRYKCVQCPDYDLCQKCEAEQNHSDHLMVRMPHVNCPSIIDAWITDSFGRHHKRQRGACPFVLAENATAEESNIHCRREKPRSKHARKSAKNLWSVIDTGLFGPPGYFNGTNSSAADPEKAAKAAEAAVKIAEATANTAKNIASKVAASVLANTQQNFGPSAPPSNETSQKSTELGNESPSTSTGARPNTQPSTNDVPRSTPSEGTSTTKPKMPASDIQPLDMLSQYIDPELINTGMDILTNLAEGFAKMLDPSNDSTNTQSQGQQRKASEASVTSNKSNSASSHTSENRNESTAESENNTTKSTPIASGAATPLPIASNSPQTASDLNVPKKAQSIDGDWQLIDNKASAPAESTDNDVIMAQTPPAPDAPTTTATVIPADSPAGATAIPPDFVQLGRDLRAHIEAEQQREQRQEPTTQQVPQSEQSKKPEDKRSIPIYHADERINRSIHAMMNMGFSNEGAWLTQLLESVNGNIPEALDLLSSAQRINQ